VAVKKALIIYNVGHSPLEQLSFDKELLQTGLKIVSRAALCFLNFTIP
jgi:hypothetical protein